MSIANYAAIKTFYESGNDLIAVFGDLVLLALIKDKKYSVKDVQTILSEKASFQVPIDVLTTILKRLHKNKWVVYSELKNNAVNSIELTSIGADRSIELSEEYENAVREKNALISAIKIKINTQSKHKSVNDSEIENCFYKLIEEGFPNIVVAVKGESKIDKKNDINKLQEEILGFISDAEKQDPTNFSRIKGILFGKVVSQAILRINLNITKSTYGNVVVYLDTNIVFSLLGWHEDFYNEPVKELVRLLKNAGCTLRVFSFTKDEIVEKLSCYQSRYGYYSTEIKVGSIYSVLKRKRISKLDIIQFIENIEVNLEKEKIEIDYSYSIKNLIEGADEMRSKLGNYKLLSPVNSINRDLAAILAIQKFRGSRYIYSLGKAKAIFLTADHQLSVYDFLEHNHNEVNTFPEVILNSDLTSILWLSGQIEADSAFVHGFLTHYLRNDVINNKLWDKFIETIRQKQAQGLITEEDVHEIISYSETENILRKEGESGIQSILNDTKIKEMKKDREQRVVEKNKDQDVIENQAKKITEIGQVIENDCMKLWQRITNSLIVGISIIVIIVIITTCILLGFNTVESIFVPAVAVMSVISIGITVMLEKDFKPVSYLIRFKNNFQNKHIQKCVMRKKSKFNL
jgi:hypothetical protein